MAPGRGGGCAAGRWLLPAATLLVGLAPGSASGAPTGGRALASGRAPRPTLLGLRPDAGPLDGGTRVALNVLGYNSSDSFTALLKGVQRSARAVKVKVTSDSEGLFLLMPDLSSLTSAGTGILVSLRWTGHQSPSKLLGPLFFRVLEPLARLAPAWISPCCSFKLSGGQPVMLSGAVPGVPAIRPLVRLRGAEHEQEVDGQLVQHEWGLASLGEDVPQDAWHVYAVMPPWPVAEDSVVIEISWNQQQFAQLPHRLRFFLQKSLFGQAAQDISEEHLARGAEVEVPGPESSGPEAATTQVSVVEGKDAKEKTSGGETDYSNALLLDHHGDAFILARPKDLSHLAEDMRIIHDLFLLTCTATVLGAVALVLRAPSIIGYLLGGVLLGPGCLDAVVELVQVESIAELGVCLLLFCIGLELTWGELRANMRASLAGLLAMILLCCLVVMFAAFGTKTPVYEALCVGLFSSLASTAVSLKALPSGSGDELPAEVQGEASALLAILVMQDIVLAGLLAVMPLVFQSSGEHGGAAAEGSTTAGPSRPAGKQKLQTMAAMTLALLSSEVLVMVLGSLGGLCVMAYRFRRKIGGFLLLLRLRVRALLLELDGDFFTMLVLSYAFAASYATDQLGLSVELGAFLAGLALTSFSVEVAKRTQHLIEGLKDTFVAWFFASIGLIVNPRFLLDNLRPILSVVMLIFLLKLFTGFLPLWLLSTRGTPRPALRALRTSWILAHVSEFGFVLASKGVAWRIISSHVYLLLVGANALSLFFAPWLFRSRDWLLPEDRAPSVAVEEDTERPTDSTAGAHGKAATGQDAGSSPGPERYGRPCTEGASI